MVRHSLFGIHCGHDPVAGAEEEVGPGVKGRAKGDGCGGDDDDGDPGQAAGVVRGGEGAGRADQGSLRGLATEEALGVVVGLVAAVADGLVVGPLLLLGAGVTMMMTEGPWVACLQCLLSWCPMCLLGLRLLRLLRLLSPLPGLTSHPPC